MRNGQARCKQREGERDRETERERERKRERKRERERVCVCVSRYCGPNNSFFYTVNCYMYDFRKFHLDVQAIVGRVRGEYSDHSEHSYKSFFRRNRV